jgi:hypothetical protein
LDIIFTVISRRAKAKREVKAKTEWTESFTYT